MGKAITLKEVARYVGCSISTLSRYENNKRDITQLQKRLYKEYIENK